MNLHGASSSNFKDSQRHFTDDECSNNSLLVNGYSSINPKHYINKVKCC